MTSYSNQIGEAAQLNIPAPHGEGNCKREITCLFGGMRGKRLLLEARERPPLSSAVSVNYNDALFLGEVVVCLPAANGEWSIEIEVEQVLSGLQSLMNLRAQLLGEGVAARPSFVPDTLCA